MSRQEFKRAVGLKHEGHFRKAYLTPTPRADLIEMSIPRQASKQQTEVPPDASRTPLPAADGNRRLTDFERQFAEFLDRAPDILRFAALGTAEQGSSDANFRVDYIKPSGAIGFYYPDWVAVQREMNGQIINWVIETKARVWEGTQKKDAAMRDWCTGVSRATGESWKYIRVDQTDFRDIPTFRALVFTVVGKAMTRKREARNATVTTEEILQWRDEGRR